MQCWNCGVETGTVERLCKACQAATEKCRAAEITPAAKIALRAPSPQRSYLKPALAVLAATFVYWQFFSDPNLSYQEDGRTLRVSDGTSSNYLNFNILASAKISGIIVDSSPSRPAISGGGIAAFVFYLNPAEYQVFQNDYIRAQRCPAGYLNAHSKTLALVPSGLNSARQLKSLKLKQGDTLLIEGQRLIPAEGQLHGLDFSFNAGDASLLTPTRLVINDQAAAL